jgi:hypothetical protein
MYLDPRGLCALWREGLLAKQVLAGRTRGYRHHPQLERFRAHAGPEAAIDAYLGAVLAEAKRRAYRFDEAKVLGLRIARPITETRGQLLHEWAHFMAKLQVRDAVRYRLLRAVPAPRPHPLFRVVAGDIRPWDKA